jgi:hypothetical protein
VKLAVYIMTLADLAKILIVAIMGFLVGIFTRWPLDKLVERRALVKSMGDRYIASAQANSNQQGKEFWRLGMLQKVGAAELSACELSRVCRRIVAHDYKTRGSERYLLFLKITVTLCEGFYVGLPKRVLT